jgi:hypothetical protein
MDQESEKIRALCSLLGHDALQAEGAIEWKRSLRIMI